MYMHTYTYMRIAATVAVAATSTCTLQLFISSFLLIYNNVVGVGVVVVVVVVVYSVSYFCVHAKNCKPKSCSTGGENRISMLDKHDGIFRLHHKLRGVHMYNIRIYHTAFARSLVFSFYLDGIVSVCVCACGV